MLRPTSLVVALLLLLNGCTGVGPPPVEPGPPESASAEAPDDPMLVVTTPSIAEVAPAVHWVRASAEHRAMYLQIFRLAGERIQGVAQGLTPGRWAVVMDADETILDNSEYQKRIVEAGAAFDPVTWNDWVREEAAVALPGATNFVSLVRDLGGRVAVVTNRDEEVCEPTRRNLVALGVVVDVVLCRRVGEAGKEARFRAVQEGTTTANLPPLEVIAWIGDNIRDFPGLAQEARDAGESLFEQFGRTYFLLPNPMYGSWEANPVR